MYEETLKIANTGGRQGSAGDEHITTSVNSKVNQICDAFLDVLQTRTSTNLQNIITAHVCKSPPDLEAGLTVVARLRGSRSRTISPAAVGADDTQSKKLNRPKEPLNIFAS